MKWLTVKLASKRNHEEKKKILEACKGWNIGAGADVFSYFLSAVGMSLTNNAHPTGQW